MNKSGKQSLFRTSLLAGLFAVGLNAQAAGLGKLLVYSAIGQPLNAEVLVTANPEELNSLSAKLASQDAFREAGIDLMPALSGLRFKVVKQAGGQALLKLSTDRPLNEPFLHFLVELSWASGRVVREYTFLLDPPEMVQVAKPASVAAPAIPAGQVVEPPPPVKAAPLPSPAKAPVETPAIAAAESTEYRVKTGDSLGKIARENQASNVSLDQMLVALFNSNREAFEGNNMNRLRAGKILRVPAATEAAAIEPKEARKIVVGQATDFNAYRRRLAEAAGTAAPAVVAAPSQQMSGKIAPQVEEKAPAAPSSDKLQVSKSESAKNPKLDDARKALEEDLIARDKALREANSRIAELEKNLENLKKLIELKSQAGAQVQQQAQAVAQTKPVEEKKPEAPPAPPKPVPEEVQAKPAAEAPPAPPTPVPAPTPTPTPAQAVENPTPVPSPAPAETPPPPKADVKKPAPPPPPPPEPDFLEENPELVLGGSALLALLAGYFGFAAWRKKKQAGAAQDKEPGLGENVAIPKPVAAAAVSELIDNGEISIQGDFSENGVLTTEESVDPVAEADVLMAYGRDRQAEEILLEGLKADPARAAIHLKLLELYANRKNTAQFEVVADQLHQLNGGRGAEWDKALSMARGLGMVGGLFGGGGTVSEVSQPVALPEPEIAAPHEATAVMVASVDMPVAEAAVEEASSLEFDLDLGTTSAPAAAAEQAPVAAPAAEEVASLDFDFDLGTPAAAEQVATPAIDVPVTEPADVAEGNSIDFALDIGSSAAEMGGGEEPAVIPAETESDGNDIDFDLDIGGGEVEATASPEMPTTAEVTLPAEPAADESGIDFDFDLGDSVVAEPPVVAAETAAIEDEPLSASLPASDSVELPEIELPPVEAAVAAETVNEVVAAEETAGEEPLALDLSAISLDLDEPVAEPASVATAEIVLDEAAPLLELPAISVTEPEVAAAEVDFDLALDDGGLPAVAEPMPEAETAPASGDEPLVLPEMPEVPAVDAAPVPGVQEADNPEVATKLELALAYEEMGDLEGARELLNEVMGEGSTAQRSAAQARLDQLST